MRSVSKILRQRLADQSSPIRAFHVASVRHNANSTVPPGQQSSEENQDQATKSSSAGEVSRDMGSVAESSNSWVKNLLAPRASDLHKTPAPAPSPISSKLSPAASWGARLTPTTSFKSRPSASSREKRSQGLTKFEKKSTEHFTQTMLEIFESAILNHPRAASAGRSSRPDWRGPSDRLGLDRDFEYYKSTAPPFARMSAQRALQKEETEEDAETIERLDELREDMEVIRYDTELLPWAVENVLTPTMVDGLPTFPRVYPRILAHLLKAVRVNYQNPHLALAIFNYAQTSSIESYLSGCLAPAYNEILRVRWESFRDFEGVEAAVREMEVNGVGWDRVTSKIVAGVIEEVQKDLLEGVVKGDDAVYARLARLEKRLERDIRDQEAFENWRAGEKKFTRQQAQRSAALDRKGGRRDALGFAFGS